jgi:hypothetical protein
MVRLFDLNQVYLISLAGFEILSKRFDREDLFRVGRWVASWKMDWRVDCWVVFCVCLLRELASLDE